MHQSIATIDSPEFINLQPLELNPLMSSCEIKVLYVGENRNHSFITKEVATEMSKTLRGAPIVGYYKTDKEDFGDHGERVIFDDEGIKFECLTKPYGFVAPDAKVWFQKFEDTDDFGNSTVREYLMTTGYLWTGQFEECKSVVEEGKPHSMELDENSLDGKWSTNTKTGMDFFIINDAIFSKLCILGDDVEPCFEGSSVTAPQVSKTFSLDDNFKNTLFTMMQDLKNFALTEEGGQTMDNLENTAVETNEAVDQNVTENNPSSEELETSFAKEDDKKKKDEEGEAKKDDSKTEPKKEEKLAEGDDSKKDASDSNPEKEEKEEDDDEKKKKAPVKNSLNEEEYAELNAKYTKLQADYQDLDNRYQKLVAFKLEVDNAKKDELINSFYMLSDEDKKDVIENKAKYSYDDIEAKLSVICVRKKVNFDLEDSHKNNNTIEENSPAVTFNLSNAEDTTPEWVTALKNARNK